ncbi:hypothetical protein SAMN05660199_01602 [Klenkia soli]|uniref:CAAX prenyl protease 2/Lysostaphin resistance protein A-like domain-containing protein n=1 Tax=Klenkia soli TaxID=1052260 RepID=A0A1H0HX23_9ACTN|nr:CPBP family intramembrane glutamic endopeptidase [Klenkia soli]SDO23707.1 hypothetical protein SAMN05660199_01602 [Klenkia soli]
MRDPGWSYTGPPATGPWGAEPQVPRSWVPVPAPPVRPAQRAPQPSSPVRGRPVTPPGLPPFDTPQPYARLMRARDWAWWRPLLGLLMFVVLYAVASVVVVVAALLTGLVPVADLLELTDPGVLLLTNLSLVVAIPIVWAAWAVAHGSGRGWSSSVTKALRRRLLLPFTWRALATIGVGAAVTIGLTLLEPGTTTTGPVPGYGWLLVVVLLTTPLQSAAEEYVFRGYLSQTIAAWCRTERTGAVVAAVLTAALFSAAHAPPDVLTFADRFVFGLAASWVTRLTGGLEAAIVLHAVNNVVVFVLAGAVGGGVTTAMPPVGVFLLVVLLDVVFMGAYVALVAAARRTLAPELVSPAVDLRGAAGADRQPGQPGWQPTWVPAPPLPPPGPSATVPEPDARWSRQGGA